MELRDAEPRRGSPDRKTLLRPTDFEYSDSFAMMFCKCCIFRSRFLGLSNSGDDSGTRWKLEVFAIPQQSNNATNSTFSQPSLSPAVNLSAAEFTRKDPPGDKGKASSGTAMNKAGDNLSRHSILNDVPLAATSCLLYVPVQGSQRQCWR